MSYGMKQVSHAGRIYPMTPQLLAWHEAGHIAANEYFGMPWFKAVIDPVELSGRVVFDAEYETAKNPDVLESAVIGTSEELKAISRKIATSLLAGIAAERIAMSLPFDHGAFLADDFHDFVRARWFLSLTGSEDEYRECAVLAHGIVSMQYPRVSCLAGRLVERNTIYSADELAA